MDRPLAAWWAPLANEKPLNSGVRSVMRHRGLRRLLVGVFLSNVGTWMQNIALGVLAYDMTGSATFVGLVYSAQLAPSLVFSIPGGVLADRFDRRLLLVIMSMIQGALCVVLAVVTLGGDANRAVLVGVVLGIGI